MKIFLYIIATVSLIIPIAIWGYLYLLGCGHITGPHSCTLRLQHYWDIEFLMLAALPWTIGAICFLLQDENGKWPFSPN